jgi:hypothetical protein
MDIYKLMFAYGLLIHVMKTYAPDGVEYTPADAEAVAGLDIDVEYGPNDEDGVPTSITVRLVELTDEDIAEVIEAIEVPTTYNTYEDATD